MSTPPNNLPKDGAHGAELLPSDEYTRHTQRQLVKKTKNRRNPKNWAMELFAAVNNNYIGERWPRVLKMQESRRFTRGEQQLAIDRQSGICENILTTPNSEGKFISADEESALLTTDHVSPAVRAGLKEITASNPEFKAGARAKNPKPEQRARARVAQAYMDFDAAIHSKPSVRQDEALFQLVCGEWYKETYYDQNAGGLMDITDYAIVPGVPESWQYQCTNCPQAGDVSDLVDQSGAPPAVQSQYGQPVVNSQCPQCGSTQLAASNTPATPPMKIPNGSHKEQVGQPVSRLFPPEGVVLEFTARTVPESTFFYTEDLMSRAVLEAMYPWADIPSSPPSPVLVLQYQLARATGSNSIPGYQGYGASGYSGPFEKLRRERLWLDPPMFQDIEIDQDIILGDPQNPTDTIPAGTKLGDKFKKGLRLYKVGDCILQWFDESKNGRWVSCGYTKNIDGFHCDGMVERIVQPQKRYNALDTLSMNSDMTCSVPIILGKRSSFDMSKMENQPGFNAVYVEEAFTGEDVNKAFVVIPALDVSERVNEDKRGIAAEIEYISGMKAQIQGTHDPSVKTFGEAAMERQQQVGLLAPPCDLRAEAESTRMYQMLELRRKYYVKGQDDFLGEFEDFEIKAFTDLNYDMAKEIEITYAPGSHIPRTQQDVKMDLMTLAGFGGVAGGAFNSQVWGPKIQEIIFEAFNNPYNVDQIEPTKRNAEKRLQKLQQFIFTVLARSFDITQPVPDPQMQPVGPPDQNGQPTTAPTNKKYAAYQALVQETVARINFQGDTDNHAVYVATYTDWMQTDDGESGPIFIQQCVLGLRQRHVDAITQAQDQAQQKQMQQQVQQGMIEKAGDVMDQAMKSDTELEKAKLDHGHGAASQAAEQAHAETMAAMQHGHDQAMASQQQGHEQQMAEAEPDADDSGG